MPRKAKKSVKKDKLFLTIEWLAARPLLTELTLTAITVLFGMQILRVLIPDINWIMGDRFGLDSLQLVLVGAAIFLLGFLSGPLSWFTGNRRLMTFTIAGIGLVRLLMQVSAMAPLFNLVLAILGTVLFIIFLPAAFEDARLRGGTSVSNFALGLLVGVALDTAISGAFGTYDLIWQTTLFPVLLTLLIFIIQLVLLIGTTPLIYHTTKQSASISLPRSFTWIAIGPFLFLELVVFQNISRLTTLVSVPLPQAFAITLVAQLAGIAAASLVVIKGYRRLWPWALGAGVILVAALAFSDQEPGILMASLFVIGQILLAAMMTMVLIGIAFSPGKEKWSAVWIANGMGMVLFILMVFAYYAVYQMALPYPNQVVELSAAGIITACAVGAVIFGKQKMKVDAQLWTVSALALILLALPLAQMMTWHKPAPSTGSGYPIIVMTYNLNDGFTPAGRLDIDRIADVIENNRPDVVALQEVSRGMLINGRLDMLEWLSRRLQMPYVYGPTGDPTFGNAIMSRYPILAFSNENLPPKGLVIKRGFILGLIDIGNDKQIKIINTQFDTSSVEVTKAANISVEDMQAQLNSLRENTETLRAEAQALIQFWGGMDSTVILGDMGGLALSPDINEFYRANLTDAGLRKDQSKTFPSNMPQVRTDYIWISGDLTVSNISVIASTASDHLPVVAVINR